jgi:hypothetical protein
MSNVSLKRLTGLEVWCEVTWLYWDKIYVGEVDREMRVICAHNGMKSTWMYFEYSFENMD